MAIKPLDIFSYYDKQRFTQFSPQDCANWYITQAQSGKRPQAMYPTMGRKHIEVGGQPVLVFGAQPRFIFKSINFVYIVVGSTIYQVDRMFNTIPLTNPQFTKQAGFLSFDYLPVQITLSGVVTQTVFCMIADGDNLYVINESLDPPTLVTITDTIITGSSPGTGINPNIVVAFANRFAVSGLDSTQFTLSAINIGGVDGFNPLYAFHNPATMSGTAVFAQENGIIREMCVLQNNLYIFCDFTTGIWGNSPSIFPNGIFPWKKNTSFEFDFGIADPETLDVDFGRMTWLAKNRNGLIEFVTSTGQLPQPISTQAINVLLQNSTTDFETSDFLSQLSSGFLYQYEDTVFYRCSTGFDTNSQILDFDNTTNCIEYNFNTQTWHRCIEYNGERNRIQKHVFFNSLHMVIVLGENAIYEMAGNIYFNESKNPASTNINDPLYFIAYPFRYELVTSIISEDDYSEFIDDYVEIDFVFGEQTFNKDCGPYANTVFLISELSTATNNIYLVAEDGVTFLITENGDTPSLDSQTYCNLFKPHIELYISDDGGISFYSADVLEFSELGVYRWRMRWYQLGPSRNRCYKLIAVSPAPIVILGAVRNTRRASGGAN